MGDSSKYFSSLCIINFVSNVSTSSKPHAPKREGFDEQSKVEQVPMVVWAYRYMNGSSSTCRGYFRIHETLQHSPVQVRYFGEKIIMFEISPVQNYQAIRYYSKRDVMYLHTPMFGSLVYRCGWTADRTLGRFARGDGGRGVAAANRRRKNWERQNVAAMENYRRKGMY